MVAAVRPSKQTKAKAKAGNAKADANANANANANGNGAAAAASDEQAANGAYTSQALQLLIVILVGLPWVALAVSKGHGLAHFFEAVMDELDVRYTLQQRDFVQEPRFWALVAAISLPHVVYFILWTNAKTFHRVASRVGEPFRVFAKLAHAIKLVQLTAAVVYFSGVGVGVGAGDLKEWQWSTVQGALDALQAHVQALGTYRLLLGVELLLVGQVLNAAVYRTIGEAGVYYGCRLGQQVPWVFSFPFCVISDPQYKGATMSVWGIIILCATRHAIDDGLFGVGVVTTIFYEFSSLVENNL